MIFPQRLFFHPRFSPLATLSTPPPTVALADPGGTDGGDTFHGSCQLPWNHYNRKSRYAASSPDEVNTGPSVPKPHKLTISDYKLHFTSTRPSAPSSSAATVSTPDHTLFRCAFSTENQSNLDGRASTSLVAETDFTFDALAIRESIPMTVVDALMDQPMPGSTASVFSEVYKGENSSTDSKEGFLHEQTVAGVMDCNAHGPLHTSAHIWMSMGFDYQP